MRFDRNNPWVVGIIAGIIVTVVGGTILYYLFEYREKKESTNAHINLVNNADMFLAKNMSNDALSIYIELLKIVSNKREAKLYAHIKSNEGICYFNLATIKNKEENLARAIQAYEEALKIRTVEKYPLDYAATQNSLGAAYNTLAEVRDKEENLAKAIHAYEEALKIRTVEKYPLDYAATQNSLGAAYNK